MKSLPATPILLNVARRVVWFKEPEEALADAVHFLAHVMTYGTIEDLKSLKGIVGKEEFSEVLDNAPPGIFDARSWAYWNLEGNPHRHCQYAQDLNIPYAQWMYKKKSIQPTFSGPHACNDPPAVRTFSVHDPVGQNKNPGPLHNRFAARRTIGVVSRMRWNIAHIGIVKAF